MGVPTVHGPRLLNQKSLNHPQNPAFTANASRRIGDSGPALVSPLLTKNSKPMIAPFLTSDSQIVVKTVDFHIFYRQKI
jgi:hypothetical protein